MENFIKEHGINIILSLVFAWVGFYGNFSSLSNQVQEQAKRIEEKVGKEEYRAILDSQKELNELFKNRMNKLNEKIDKLLEREK